MIEAIFFTAALLIVIFFIGYGWIVQLSQRSLWRPVFAQLLGMAIFLVTGSFIVQLNFSTIWILIASLFLGAAGFISAIIRKKFVAGFTIGSFRPSTFLLSFAPLTIVFLQTRDFFSSQISFRIGPDNLGWATASSYLCRGGDLFTLRKSIENQVFSSDIIASFLRPLPPNTFSINRINSYTDQASSEFLIGAHRTGGPGAVSSVCEIAGFDFFPAIFIAFISWSVLLLAMIIRSYALEQGVKHPFAIVIALVISLNVNLLSVTLEGGFGQTLTLPYFFIAVVWISRKKINFYTWFSVIFLLVAVASATYLDVLFIAAPFLAVSLIIRIFFWRDIEFAFDKRFVLALVGMAIASIPMYAHIYRLVLSPISNPTHGGWNQGNFPLLNNVLGFASRLPQGISTFLEPRTNYEWIYDIATSLLIFILFVLTYKKLSIPFIPTVLAYSVLIYSVYFSNAVITNNYRIWKFSEYAAVFVSVLLIDVLSRNMSKAKFQNSETFFSKAQKSKFVFLSVILLLFMQALTSLVWSIDWKNSSSVTLTRESANELKPYLDRYDFVIICGAYTTQYSILGDLRYASYDRGAGPVQRSQPERPLAFLTPGNTNSNQDCTDYYLDYLNIKEFKVIEQNKEFQIIQVEY